MRIVCFIDSLGSGGAQRQMVELAKGFKIRGNDVIFLVYHEKFFYRESLEKHDIRIKVIKEPNPILRVAKIRRFIRSSRPGAVISFLQIPNLISILSSFPFRRWRLVVGERSADPAIFRSFRRRVYRWLYVFADFVVSNSHENMRIVKRINPLLTHRKFRVIYNVIDIDLWRVTDSYIPLKDNKLHLSVASSHRYLKNARGLVEAINMLDAESKAKLEVSWYGRKDEDGSYREVKGLVMNYGLNHIIRFYKSSSNIPEVFANSDVVGLFSLHEGLPNTVCEAIVLGKPVVASNISDIPILLGYKDEVLFNPNDYTEIAMVLEHLISLSSSQLLRLGKENMLRSHSLLNQNEIIDSYLSCLTEGNVK